MQGRDRSVGHLQACVPALKGTEAHIGEQLVAGWTKATLYRHQCLGPRHRRQYSFDPAELNTVRKLTFVESVCFVIIDMGEEEEYEDDQDFDYDEYYSD